MACYYLRDDKMHILQVACSTPLRCLGKNTAAIIQGAPLNLEEISDRVLVGEDVDLKVQIKGKNMKRFKCDAAYKPDCSPAKKGQSLTKEEERPNVQNYVITPTTDPSANTQKAPRPIHTHTLARISTEIANPSTAVLTQAPE